MHNETFTSDPTNPEAPHLLASHASEIGSSMLQGAADAVGTTSTTRAAEHDAQLARPLVQGLITEIPTTLRATNSTTTTPETTILPTTVPLSISETTVPLTTTLPKLTPPPTVTTITTVPFGY